MQELLEGIDTILKFNSFLQSVLSIQQWEIYVTLRELLLSYYKILMLWAVGIMLRSFLNSVQGVSQLNTAVVLFLSEIFMVRSLLSHAAMDGQPRQAELVLILIMWYKRR